MVAQKEVKVKVATEEDLSGVDALELKLNQLKKQKIQLNIDAKTEQLNRANNRIDEIKTEIKALEALNPHLGVDVDNSKINALKTELAQLEHDTLDLEINIETGELEKAKLEINELDDEEINIQLNNQSAMQGIDEIAQGFDRLKQGASEVGGQMMDILDSAAKQETNKVFLEQSYKRQGKSADEAADKIKGINDAVQKLPGDDSIMQGLLSQAAAKDLSLTNKELETMGGAAADYFAAMEYFGKSSSEAFQDMNNYLLTGQTMEIERSPILANHIDKLKEANSIQERSVLLQEALTEEGWGGMSDESLDLYSNKLETFNGMLERGRYNLGGMFQEGAKQAMDFIMTLDQGTDGLVGMGLAALSFASPLKDMVVGTSQVVVGLKGIKDAVDFSSITDKLSSLKDMLMGVGGKAKEAALSMLDLGKKALIAGYNALKSAAMWAVEKAQLIAETIASYAAATAQAFLNLVMSMNPIMLVVIAVIALVAILVYLYYNVDWVREAFDNLASTLMGAVTGAINWLMGLFNTFISSLAGVQAYLINGINYVVNFIGSIPNKIYTYFSNIISNAINFASNFANNLKNGAINAVNGFISWISQLPSKLAEELDKMLQMAEQFALDIANKLTGGAAGMVLGWITGSGEHSPGYMYDAFTGELDAMEKAPSQYDFSMQSIGQDMVSNFNPKLQTSNAMGLASGNTINIEIGTVDNEDRIQEIVKAVEDSLNFDNLTAGRSV